MNIPLDLKHAALIIQYIERMDWGGIAKAAVAEREKRLLEEANPDTPHQGNP